MTESGGSAENPTAPFVPPAADSAPPAPSAPKAPGPAVQPWAVAAGLGMIFVILAITAWLDNTSFPGGYWAVIVTTLLGVIVNPRSARADASAPARTASGSLTESAWQVLVGVGAIAAVLCAIGMAFTGHPSAQGAFEVTVGGLAGLLINGSRFAVPQTLLQDVRGLLGKPGELQRLGAAVRAARGRAGRRVIVAGRRRGRGIAALGLGGSLSGLGGLLRPGSRCATVGRTAPDLRDQLLQPRPAQAAERAVRPRPVQDRDLE